MCFNHTISSIKISSAVPRYWFDSTFSSAMAVNYFSPIQSYVGMLPFFSLCVLKPKASKCHSGHFQCFERPPRYLGQKRSRLDWKFVGPEMSFMTLATKKKKKLTFPSHRIRKLSTHFYGKRWRPKWSPRGDGIMDSVLACRAGEPGSIPALSKWFFSRV